MQFRSNIYVKKGEALMRARAHASYINVSHGRRRRSIARSLEIHCVIRSRAERAQKMHCDLRVIAPRIFIVAIRSAITAQRLGSLCRALNPLSG